MTTPTDLLPPPHCFTRDECVHILISARNRPSSMGWGITLFAAMWNFILSIQLGFFITQFARNGTFQMTVNGKLREIAAAEFALFLSPFFIVGLLTLLIACFIHCGRVEARVTRDSVNLFTGLFGLGRNRSVPRNLVRDVTIRNAGMKSSSGDNPKVISLEGSDITTGIALGRAGRDWFAQELRRALNLPAVSA
jgi:hypothetical protein